MIETSLAEPFEDGHSVTTGVIASTDWEVGFSETGSKPFGFVPGNHLSGKRVYRELRKARDHGVECARPRLWLSQGLMVSRLRLGCR